MSGWEVLLWELFFFLSRIKSRIDARRLGARTALESSIHFSSAIFEEGVEIWASRTSCPSVIRLAASGHSQLRLRTVQPLPGSTGRLSIQKQNKRFRLGPNKRLTNVSENALLNFKGEFCVLFHINKSLLFKSEDKLLQTTTVASAQQVSTPGLLLNFSTVSALNVDLQDFYAVFLT